jgi:hypothetical protein
VLHDKEVALLLRVCRDHEVAYCRGCRTAYKLLDLGFDPTAGRRFHQCPLCGHSTDDALRIHLITCPKVLAEVAAGRAEVIKKTRALVDQSLVKLAESEERLRRAPEPPAIG